MNQAPPFDGSYWVIPGKFLAGCYPGSEDANEMEQKLISMLGVGVRSIINLMEENETNWFGRPFIPYADQFEWLARQQQFEVRISRIPIVDLGVPERPTMIGILDRVDAVLNDNQPVYLHCLGGIGRTGTVVGCYLIRHGLAAADNVMSHIDKLRRTGRCDHRKSPETNEQRQFVLSWNKHV